MRIAYLANGSFVAGNGVQSDAENVAVIWLGEGDVLTVTVDWSDLLSSISSTTVSAHGVTASSAVSGTTQTLTLSGVTSYAGRLDLTATDGTQTFARQIVTKERTKRHRRDYDHLGYC